MRSPSTSSLPIFWFGPSEFATPPTRLNTHKTSGRNYHYRMMVRFGTKLLLNAAVAWSSALTLPLTLAKPRPIPNVSSSR